jgi:hypothetical protein
MASQMQQVQSKIQPTTATPNAILLASVNINVMCTNHIHPAALEVPYRCLATNNNQPSVEELIV